jgi:glutaredoxin/glutathione-dependent peroxiredoxin
MTIKLGERLPAVVLTRMQNGAPAPVNAADLFAGKKAVLFAVPGAFTPTCSAKHLPGFVELAGAFRNKGVEVIACVSVNDIFVMDAWGEAQGANDRVLMLADGNGDFAKALGVELDATRFGMGLRSKRYAMLLEDGVVTTLNIDDAGAFDVSSAEYLLQKL